MCKYIIIEFGVLGALWSGWYRGEIWMNLVIGSVHIWNTR